MKILLTNDDGYDHPGINTLFQELSKHHEVFMMAPDTNKSGFSSALTFLTPITEQKIEEKRRSHREEVPGQEYLRSER